MSDAIEAACRAYLLERDIDPDYPHGLKPGAPAWWKTEVPAMTAAITAYEAAKGGGIGVLHLDCASVSKLAMGQMLRTLEATKRAKSVDIVIRKDGVDSRHEADWLKYVSATASPASGERDAVIEECAKVAEAEELTGDAPSHFTQHEIDIVTGTVRSTARSIAAAIRALRMEGK